MPLQTRPDDEDGNGLEAMIDLEVSLVKTFGWSLRDIDETDVESLLDFVGRLTEKQGIGDAGGYTGRGKRAYCDTVDWL